MMNLLPFVLFSDVLGGNSKPLVRRMFPTMVGPNGPVLALLMAKQDLKIEEQAVRDRERANIEIIEDVKKNAEVPNAEELKNRFSKVYDLLVALPQAEQDRIFPPLPPANKVARKPGASP